jgi:hypothetical protein
MGTGKEHGVKRMAEIGNKEDLGAGAGPGESVLGLEECREAQGGT